MSFAHDHSNTFTETPNLIFELLLARTCEKPFACPGCLWTRSTAETNPGAVAVLGLGSFQTYGRGGLVVVAAAVVNGGSVASAAFARLEVESPQKGSQSSQCPQLFAVAAVSVAPKKKGTLLDLEIVD